MGTWTCWLAQHYKHIYSVEPVHYHTLEHNCRATDTHNVTVIPHAVSDTHSTQTIWVREDNSGDTGFLDSTSGRQPQEIQTITIDSLELDNITGIKMDLQGHELEALLGAEHTVHKYKPTLCVELGKGNTHIEALLSEWQYVLEQQCGKDWIYKHTHEK